MGKGGGDDTKDYFASIACLICAGPVDELVAVIMDAKLVYPEAPPWEAGISYKKDSIAAFGGRAYQWIPSTASTPGAKPGVDPGWIVFSIKRFNGGIENSNPFLVTVKDIGSIDFYWGTATQSLKTSTDEKHPRSKFIALGHPPYRNQCFALLWNFKFGRERVEAPNIEFVTRRTAQTTFLSTRVRALVDGQSNPVAAEIELLTDPIFGAGIDRNRLSSQCTIEAESLVTEEKRYYLSVAVDGGSTVRRIVGETIAYRDGFWLFDNGGFFTTGRFPTTAPVFDSGNIVDATSFEDEPTIEEHDWSEASTEVVVSFTNAVLAFKTDARKAVSGHARLIVGEPRTKKLERPYITRSEQAAKYAAEWLRSFSEPYITGSVRVRAGRAARLFPGSLFRLDIAQLPISIVCRVLRRRLANPPDSHVQIEFESDRMIGVIPYQSNPTARPDVDAIPAEIITLYAFFQPPPDLVLNQPYRVVVIPARKSPVTQRVRVWLKQRDTDEFYELGSLFSFGVVGALTVSYPADRPDPDLMPPDDTSGTLLIKLDKDSNPEDVRRMTESQTLDAIDDNALVLWLCSTSDIKTFEVLTVISMILVAEDPATKAQTYSFNVRRGRYSTQRLDFQSGALAFLIYRRDLVFLTHAAIPVYASTGATAIFRLQASNTEGQETALADCPDLPFGFFDAFAPSIVWDYITANGAPWDSALLYDMKTSFKYRVKSSDPTGDLTQIQVSALNGTQEVLLYSRTFEATGGYNFESSFKPSSKDMDDVDADWHLVATARDATGRVRQVDAGILRLRKDKSNPGLTAPVATPPSGPHHNRIELVVTLSQSSAGTLEWTATKIQNTSVPGGTWVLYQGSIHLTMGTGYDAGRTLFARYRGVSNSPVGIFQYWYQP